MPKITKDKFFRYRETQMSGLINMYDRKNGCALTGLTKEEYTDIQQNYKRYSNKWVKE